MACSGHEQRGGGDGDLGDGGTAGGHMARVVGLIVLACLLAAAWVVAQASVAPSVQSYYTNSVEGGSVSYLSAQAACDGGIAAMNAGGGVFNYNNGSYETVAFRFLSGSQCGWYGTRFGDSDTFYVGAVTGTTPSCPVNSTSNSSGTCDCNSGYRDGSDGLSCRATTNSDCGAVGQGSSIDENSVYPVSGRGVAPCINGCAMHAGTVACSGATCFATGPYSQTGQACAPTASETPNASAGSCLQQGKCYGQVNNVGACVTCTATTTSSVSATSSTSASGVSSSSTTTTSSTTTSGGTTTTTTTTNSDGSSSTTVSTGGGAGSAASSASPASGSASSSSFSGTCSASFTCDGDAVQCAVAMEQHQRDCTFYQPETVAGTVSTMAGKFSTAVNDGSAPSWSPAASGNVSTTTMDFASQLNSDSVWGAACPADRSITGPFGFMFNVPLSQLCVPLQMAGTALLGVCYLIAAFIVFRK